MYDLATDRDFDEALEHCRQRPSGWFHVPTRLGGYNPDWAVLFEPDGADRLYFAVETKSSLFDDELRDGGKSNIDCGTVQLKAMAEQDTTVRGVLMTC